MITLSSFSYISHLVRLIWLILICATDLEWLFPSIFASHLFYLLIIISTRLCKCLHPLFFPSPSPSAEAHHFISSASRTNLSTNITSLWSLLARSWEEKSLASRILNLFKNRWLMNFYSAPTRPHCYLSRHHARCYNYHPWFHITDQLRYQSSQTLTNFKILCDHDFLNFAAIPWKASLEVVESYPTKVRFHLWAYCQYFQIRHYLLDYPITIRNYPPQNSHLHLLFLVQNCLYSILLLNQS